MLLSLVSSYLVLWQDVDARAGRLVGWLHNNAHCDLRHLHASAVERRVGLFRQPLGVRLPSPATGPFPLTRTVVMPRNRVLWPHMFRHVLLKMNFIPGILLHLSVHLFLAIWQADLS